MQEKLNEILSLLKEIKDTMPKRNKRIKPTELFDPPLIISTNLLDPNKKLYTGDELFELYKDYGFGKNTVIKALRRAGFISPHPPIRNKRRSLNNSFIP